MDLDELRARSVVTASGCWEWGDARTNGYGVVRIGGRLQYTHRLACLLAHGDPPDPRSEARHSCDNPPCCNPAHLRWGSHAQNMAEAAERGRARNSGVYRGVAHHSSKLDFPTAERIRRAYAGGATLKGLAAEYGVHFSSIHAIVQYRTWRSPEGTS